MAITLPFAFVNGTIADAVQVNANLTALANGALPIAGTGTTNMTGPITIQTAGTSGNSYIEFLGANGTATSPTASNGPIGGVYAGGFNGTSWTDGGQIAIDFYADGLWTPTSQPTRITFGTTPPNGTHAIPRLTINSDGTMLSHDALILQSGIADGGNSYFECLGCENTVQSPAALQNNSVIGGIYGGGYNGNAWSDGGQVAIDFWAAGAWSPTSQPTRITIGTTAVGSVSASPTMELRANHDVNVIGNLTAANFPSEARFKDHIEDYSQGLAAITQLRPVSWEWNELSGIIDPHRPVQYGVLADEAQQSLPQAIGTRQLRGEVVKTLDDRPILYALVNAVKELADRISTIEEKIDAV